MKVEDAGEPLTGRNIGSYQILSLLGAGGMGEVYRAHDTKLGRDVAIKVLPASFARDPERLHRFELEARILAALNHPNIGAIYGLEQIGSGSALVLELIEGPTLADRIAQGPIPLEEALSIAGQITKALQAAHERGTIHRDLKPANIKLKSDGVVKLLDFGLAKEINLVTSLRNESQDLTIASPLVTGKGVILGTPAYLSPEQARGKVMDKRSDIWQFGCVLYEMLVSRPPFGAETFSDTIASILDREPDWQSLPSATPRKIRDLIRRCLRKDQQLRLHDIGDARIAIEEAQTKSRVSRRALRAPVAVGARSSTAISGRSSTPSLKHAPVSVLIADLDNRTNDPTFSRVLEPLLKLALEGASFINAFDRSAVVRHVGVKPPESLHELAALDLAVRQGLSVVLSGSLEHRGAGFTVSLKAIQAVTGEVITTASSTAAKRDHVVSAVTKVATTVRKALGDDLSDSAQRFATQTFSATSLEAVREYAAASGAMSESKFEEALQRFAKAVQLDATFGVAHAGMALVSHNLGKLRDAEHYIKEALRHLDGMSERERYRTRAVFYRITGDYHACVKEYGELVARNSADAPARNNIALCWTFLRNLPRAVDEMRYLLDMFPNRDLYRINLALYAAYSGDFNMAETEARAIKEPSQFGLLALAFAHLLQGQLLQAAETYKRMAQLDQRAASHAESGLGDIALYEGRFSDAARIFSNGAEADLIAKDYHGAAHKFAALADVRLLRQEFHAAVDAAEKALENSQTAQIRFVVARVFVAAGLPDRARALASELGSELPVEPQAYARIIDGIAELKDGRPRDAIKMLTEAVTLLDTWIGRFDLGRAYLEAGALPQADSAFDRCIVRRGEALALFLDERPTYGCLPLAYYYQGRVREALNTSGFANSYRVYLGIRGESGEDPLVSEVRRRASI